MGYITSTDLGKATGGNSRRKPVVKLTPNGEITAAYCSARQAARENHMSYQTVIDRCNKKAKKDIAIDGFIYAWDEDLNY